MSYPRSDELASESRINRAKERDTQYKSAAKTVGALALSAGGAAISARLAPFLSELLPMDLALKGISKVAPKVGDFLKQGMEKGLTLQSGLGFLKENMGGKEETQPAKDSRNIIQQYSPELYDTIKNKLKAGGSFLESVMGQDLKGKYKSVIEKMEKDHKIPWLQIAKEVFGGGETVQPEQQTPQQMQQPGQAQTGGIDPAVMQIIQQGSEILKRFKGSP